MNAVKATSFKCNVCGDIWRSLRNAKDCCPVSLEVTSWQCQECYTRYEDNYVAEQCCRERERVTQGDDGA